MKRKSRIVLIVGIAVTLLLSACTIVVTPSGTEWSLYYTWEGHQQRYAIWTLYSDGTFEDNYGGEGYWSIQDSFFQLSYNNSTYFYTGTVYTGSASNSSMSGTMQGPDVYGYTHYGTWSAYRGGRGVKTLTTTPGLSPSGKPIE